jgi:hypothetical protein
MAAPSPQPAMLSESEEDVDHPQSLAALRVVKRLVGIYLGISVLTMVAVVLLRNNASLVTVTVWVRGIIVVVTALLMYPSARLAAPVSDTAGCG